MRIEVGLVALMLALAACGGEGKPAQVVAGGGGSQPSAAGEAGPAPLGPRVQPTARAMLMPVGMQQVDPSGQNGAAEIFGQATFTTTEVGMDLAVQAIGCRGFASYPLRIVDAADCAQLASARGWERGEGIPNVPPLAGAGLGRLNYVQKKSDPRAWTVGGERATDVVGRAIVLYDAAEPGKPLACGMIEAGETLVTPVEIVAQERALPARVRGTLAGMCSASLIARETTHDCPNPETTAECTSAHCDVASCVVPCAEYTACLIQRGDACAADCVAPEACLNCMLKATSCALDFCEHELYCAAPPVPGGPCDKMRECCMKQGERAEYCLNTVNRYEKLSGVPSCVGLMTDLPFTTNIIHDPPCVF